MVKLTFDRRDVSAQVVYFAYDAQADLTKIGTTWLGHLSERVRTHERAIGRPLRLLGTIWGDRHAEKEIHDDLEATRDHGEWFRASPDLAALVAILNTHGSADGFWGGWEGF
jgi:hypothetical protein